MPFHCVFPNHHPCQLLLKLVTVISSWERRGGCEHPSEEEVRRQRAGKVDSGITGCSELANQQPIILQVTWGRGLAKTQLWILQPVSALFI